MPTVYHPGQKIDHYEIILPLGRGGASHVYLAHDWHAQQEVVLKFPDDEMIGGAAVFERYKREEEIGKRLDHPRILRHLNLGEQRSREYQHRDDDTSRKISNKMERDKPQCQGGDEC